MKALGIHGLKILAIESLFFRCARQFEAKVRGLLGFGWWGFGGCDDGLEAVGVVEFDLRDEVENVAVDARFKIGFAWTVVNEEAGVAAVFGIQVGGKEGAIIVGEAAEGAKGGTVEFATCFEFESSVVLDVGERECALEVFVDNEFDDVIENIRNDDLTPFRALPNCVQFFVQIFDRSFVLGYGFLGGFDFL